ncbi:receptor-type tyrosine-protein phosphatase eta-like isoform X4 [Polypterus senegalus]|uniref:receptor-type tyrosine-protein phosphatase eta-like isoform X4 n=1 Tax=Polypterus senegalus TaxID=55291 RepID=UPI0019653ABF|nr:receptor-type tyrosine-protein phosphatase eta-like isoform X4 [Polypterus senegalus]
MELFVTTGGIAFRILLFFFLISNFQVPFVQSQPGSVGNLTVETSTTSASLSWTPPAENNVAYNVTVVEANITMQTNHSSANVTGLIPATRYTFIVTLVAQDNQNGSNVNITKYTIPDIVGNLTFMASTTSVSLSWNPPNGGNVKYRVEVVNINKTLWTNNSSINVTDLTPATSYTFSVTAVTLDNQTEGSNVTITRYTLPDIVGNLTFMASTTSASLSWNPPNGGNVKYRVEVVNINKTLWTNNSSINVTDLTPATSYTFSVTAVTLDNQTEGSNVTITRYTLPDIVGNLTFMASTTSARLSWNPPNGGNVKYRVEVVNINKTLWTNNSSINVTDLTPATSYTFSVTAVTLDNQTEGSNVTITRYTLPDIVGNLTFMASTTSASLSWNPSDGGNVKYRVEVVNINKTLWTNNSSINVTDLTPATSYTFSVTAVTLDNQTEGSNVTITRYTLPDTVGNLTFMALTTSASLVWNPSNGCNVTYKVQIVNIGRILWTNSSSINVTDLFPATSYTFSVTAVALDNQTEGSNTTIIRYTLPDTVGNLTFMASTTSASLSWNPSDGGNVIYKVQIVDISKILWTNSSSINVTDLFPATGYTFSVAAVALDNLTEGSNTTITRYTLPDTVGNLTFMASTTSASLSWNPSNGGNVIYKVQIVDISKILWTNSSSINVTNLFPATSYTFSVTAVALDNQTEGSNVTITRYTLPDTVGNLTFMASTTSASLLWNPSNGGNVTYKVQIVNIGRILWTNSSSINATDLFPATSYTFSVTAVALDNQTEGSNTTIIRYTLPDTVGNLTFMASTTSASLSWNPANGGNVTYKVQIVNIGRILWTNSSSINVTDLFPATSYTFSVAAVALDNQTEGSNTTIIRYTLPETVRNLIFMASTTSALLSWNPPNGGTVTYRAEVVNINKTLWTNSSFINVTALTPATSYTFSVTAVALDHQTEGSNVTITRYTLPNIIVNPTSVALTTSSISLSWSPPVGGSVTYKVYLLNNGTVVLTNTSSVNVTGLMPATSYQFSVSAVAQDHETEGNNVTITQYTKPGPIGNLTVTASATFALVSWILLNGSSVTYKVMVVETSRIFWTNYSSINVTDLNPATNYTFRVTAVALDYQTEGSSATIIQYTLPNVIMNPTSVALTTSSISLSWSPPKGGSVTYKVYLLNNGTVVLTNISSINVTGLMPATSYQFSVSAVAQDHKTEGNNVTITQYTKPGKVEQLNTTTITATSILLSWYQAQGVNISYKIIVLDQQSYSSTFYTSNSSFNVAGLSSGTSFSFNVTALAADNATEGYPNTITGCTNAAQVQNAHCFGPDNNPVLNITWQPPSGSYSAIDILINNVQSQHTVFPSNNSYTVNNLKYATNYNINITTISCGENSFGVVLNCNTGISSPPVPSGPLNVNIQEKTYQTVKFSFKSFSNENGNINAYAVIVTSNTGSTTPNNLSLSKTYTDYSSGNTDSYVTAIITQSSEEPSVTIGDGTSYYDYKNNVLAATKSYRIAVAAFTKLTLSGNKASNGNLIDTAKSFFSITLFSDTIYIPENPAVIGGAVGGTLAALLILALLTAILFIYWKRRSKNLSSSGNAVPFNKIKKNIPVKIENYEDYYHQQTANENCGFAIEYEDLKFVGTNQPKMAGLSLDNKGKNRYNNVLPYDVSRVKLLNQGNISGDYINANYMPGFNSKKEFIAAQGPLPNTTEDFWRMIWEQNVHTLIMLTRCNEQGRVKCEQYWPSNNTQTYGNIQVSLVFDAATEDWTIRDFTIKNHLGENRNIRHFHFTAWPDHGVPETTDLLIKFRDLVRDYMNLHSRNSPTIIHCSAGVGRTGTLIALDHLILQIEKEGIADVYGIVYGLRMHRPLMVQTEDQYVFLNRCALDIIRSKDFSNSDLIYQNTAALGIYENFVPNFKRENGYRC